MIARLRDSAIFHSTRLLSSAPNRALLPLPPGELFVSITFDDFPRSAVRWGAKVLEDHGARGTYYVSMGLLREDATDTDGFTAHDLLEVQRRGHELGCHTDSHLDCFSANDARVLTDVARNEAAFRSVCAGAPLRHFAWPYGRLRPSHKALLGARFETLRSTFPGAHQGAADLRLLRANKLYPSGSAARRAKVLVEGARARGGWLIFFTHDVCERPTPFGLTPRELDGVVAHARKAGATVLPLGAVVARCAATPAAASERDAHG